MKHFDELRNELYSHPGTKRRVVFKILKLKLLLLPYKFKNWVSMWGLTYDEHGNTVYKASYVYPTAEALVNKCNRDAARRSLLRAKRSIQ